jgi:hypothetical protein
MNNDLHSYPAALYSSVAEIGYRNERFTDEALHPSATQRNRRRHHRRGRHARAR